MLSGSLGFEFDSVMVIAYPVCFIRMILNCCRIDNAS
ncbi:unnamed protein product [Schistosoma curassoni]|uniref:DUF3265 domain-containing protein n=1 Tax=Schistosoma curassoni TaxID=6186 RepID=A0A183JQI7_9TREM|nr:unnamed protein product [Schistosoma curassoni]